MTEAVAAKKKAQSTPTAAQVADYLRKHPEFFDQQEQLLADLQLPPAHGTAAISLSDRQVRIMRERNTELRNRLSQLVAVARDNERLFEQIRRLGLALLEADSLDAVVSTIQNSMCRDFHMDHAHLFLYDAAIQNRSTPLVHAFVTTLSQAQAQETVGSRLQDNQVSCGAFRNTELALLFPQQEMQQGSAALIPLHYQHPLGVLAIGSNDPSHFSPSMDRLFVSWMGDAIARRLATFL
ncbi:conserved hypothetical protein [gamma proteobacterium HdN1]|nr:conserved hypothetical protein [gamma proteobacterium HdN1]